MFIDNYHDTSARMCQLTCMLPECRLQAQEDAPDVGLALCETLECECEPTQCLFSHKSDGRKYGCVDAVCPPSAWQRDPTGNRAALLSAAANITGITVDYATIHGFGELFEMAGAARKPQMLQLSRLSVRGNLIQTLTIAALDAVPALEFLDVRDNEITTVHAGAFTLTPQLKVLRIGGNRLDLLTPGTFKVYTGLREVSVQLQHLRRIELDNNRLEKIPVDMFDDLPALDAVVITGNRFRKWEEFSSNRFGSDAFKGATGLRMLDFSSNWITQISAEWFTYLGRLEVLSFSSNGLTMLPALVFRSLINLIEIRLNNNNISVRHRTDLRTARCVNIV